MAAASVSVVMATYNGARFLEPQLASIAAQTRLPDELVVCDDQSSDESVEIVERFASRAPFEVRVVRNPDRLGFAGNFLHAARLSRGDLIAWSDQDDVWMPEKLAVCARELENDDEVLLVVHASQFGEWMRHGRPVVRGATGDWFGRFTPRRVRRRTVYTPTSLPLRTRFPGRSSLVSRRVLNVADALETRLPGIIDEFESHHDLWIGFVAGAIGKVVILPDALVQYRLHDAQVTGRAAPPKGAADRAKATANRWGRASSTTRTRAPPTGSFGPASSRSWPRNSMRRPASTAARPTSTPRSQPEWQRETTTRPRRRATRHGGARCTVGAERWHCDASSSAVSVHFRGQPRRVSSQTSRAETTAPAISAVSVSGAGGGSPTGELPRHAGHLDLAGLSRSRRVSVKSHPVGAARRRAAARLAPALRLGSHGVDRGQRIPGERRAAARCCEVGSRPARARCSSGRPRARPLDA